ncbi:MAG: dihydrofolate reductase, partial [Verrucomicrobiota bacterium]
LAESEPAEEAFVIGGASIYRAAFPMAHRLYLTRVHAEVEGDTFFPDFDLGEWEETFREEHRDDERAGEDYTFFVYERR